MTNFKVCFHTGEICYYLNFKDAYNIAITDETAFSISWIEMINEEQIEIYWQKKYPSINLGDSERYLSILNPNYKQKDGCTYWLLNVQPFNKKKSIRTYISCVDNDEFGRLNYYLFFKNTKRRFEKK